MTESGQGIRPRFAALVRQVEQRVCVPADDEETRRRKVQFVVASVMVIPAGAIWAAIYWVFREPRAAVIPLVYAVVTPLGVALLCRTRRYDAFRVAQMIMIIVLPTALHIALGGFVGSSVVIFWSFLAVLMALLFGTAREARVWLGLYIGALVLAAAVAPSLAIDNNLPAALVRALFVLNLGTVSSVSFLVLFTFVTVRSELRKLESAYLRQELLLRQSEKLATLGTLAAGITHELNNPAAATVRAAEQLREAQVGLQAAALDLSRAGLDEAAWARVRMVGAVAADRAAEPPRLDALLKSDLEAEVEDWLEGHGVADGWEIAGPLVAQGLDGAALDELAGELPPQSLAAVVTWAARVLPVGALVHEIGQGAARISEIVVALKSYAYLGQAPLVEVDIHEGLENTLVILRGKLRAGVTVQRDYCTDMPKVPAYGSELNQVWTNLLDNAIQALGGRGAITIRTRREGRWGVVEIEDNGPGIPPDIQARVFDPFFTTKAPGQGTGLGLSTSHAIIVDKHKGELFVESRPGCTRFTARLPLGKER